MLPSEKNTSLRRDPERRRAGAAVVDVWKSKFVWLVD